MALLGSEIQGYSYSRYIEQEDLHTDDFIVCTFNLSCQIPDYIFMLAVLANAVKWVKLTNTFNHVQIPKFATQYLTMIRAISVGIILFGSFYKCFNTCSKELV